MSRRGVRPRGRPRRRRVRRVRRKRNRRAFRRRGERQFSGDPRPVFRQHRVARDVLLGAEGDDERRRVRNRCSAAVGSGQRLVRRSPRPRVVVPRREPEAGGRGEQRDERELAPHARHRVAAAGTAPTATVAAAEVSASRHCAAASANARADANARSSSSRAPAPPARRPIGDVRTN